ncbi:ABC transporter permease [Myceligenerans pegani]|uniref:ABC transporter permease n=1 Tax=Myceligenerans pegani TaxID=2776917 RepID=A0ABR9N5K6_9MICO|nr:ABC transporter permease [Myceligenerans sp. TRM 65318]MBE1878409.1 ABC transporter permease [Myceligenerans sp. TRM 65318]MBE3020680.1 ABC transporter permease [Myceligenerans sp. TRM 65318]
MTASTPRLARNGPPPGAPAAAAAGPRSGRDTGAAGQPGPGRPTRRRPPARTLLLVLNACSIVAGVAIWWILSLNGFQFPTPPEVVEKAVQLGRDGLLRQDVLASLGRVLTGFLLGSAAAIPVGFLMGWYTVARGLFEPWIQFFRTIPPLALLPLVLVLMGIGELPKVFVIFLAAFLACVISTYQGVVSVDRTLINAARVLGAKDGTIFVRVVVPASTPFILVGMRVGLGSAWATLVAAELLAAQVGLGYRMQQAQLYYDLATIFVGIILIGVLGLVMDRLLLLAESRLTGWQERR